VSAEINGDAINQINKKQLFAAKNQEFSASFKIIIIQTVVPTAASAVTQAAIARILSNALTVGAAAAGRAAGRGAAGAAAGAAAVERWAAGAAADERNVVEAGGVGTSGDPVDAPVGPPGGSVGSLMVGAAVGLGGKLMRTVSFFGWTRPVDFFNGSAPAGAPGLIGGMSAITL
jgi:hypothetical protein